MVRVKDVAREAGVSVGTVSNVLNNLDTVAPEYVERVNRAVEQLGFVRNGAARSLRSGQSRILGLLIPDGENPFFTSIARGAEIEFEPSGGIVLVGHTHNEQDREARYLDAFAEQMVHGVILQSTGPRDARMGARLTRLRERGTPIVVLGPPDPSWTTSFIFTDDLVGGKLAAEHLVGIGRRRLAFVGGPMKLPMIAGRLRGAEGVSPFEVIETADTTIDAGREVGEAIAARRRHGMPDGIFAANDLVAIGIIGALSTAGIRVPEDISIVGYDDIGLASVSIPALTSIRQPSTGVGQAAARMIEHQRSGGEPEILEMNPVLIVRGSTIPQSDAGL